MTSSEMPVKRKCWKTRIPPCKGEIPYMRKNPSGYDCCYKTPNPTEKEIREQKEYAAKMSRAEYVKKLKMREYYSKKNAETKPEKSKESVPMIRSVPTKAKDSKMEKAITSVPVIRKKSVEAERYLGKVSTTSMKLEDVKAMWKTMNGSYKFPLKKECPDMNKKKELKMDRYKSWGYES